MAKRLQEEFGSLQKITDLFGKDCTSVEERKYIGYPGMILILISEHQAPGQKFIRFYPYDKAGVFTDTLTTPVGRITKTLDTLVLQSRFDTKYLFSREYNLTPDAKFILELRAGILD